jgi:hypothetical protein
MLYASYDLQVLKNKKADSVQRTFFAATRALYGGALKLLPLKHRSTVLLY